MLRTALPLAAAAALCGTGSSALAADRYVTTSGSNTSNTCTAEAQPCLTIQHAVGQSADGDVVHVGPGTYTGAVSALNRVTIIGAGSGDDPATSTHLQPASGFAIRMLDGGGVERMRVTGGGGGGPGQALVATAVGTGSPLAYVLREVMLIGGNNASAGAPALQAMDGGTGRMVAVTAQGVELVGRAPSGAPTVSTVLVDGPTTTVELDTAIVRGGAATNDHGVEARDGGHVVIRRSEIGREINLLIGVILTGHRSTAFIERTRANNVWAYTAAQNHEQSLVVRDSFIGAPHTGQGAGLGINAINQSTITADVRQSTIVSLDHPTGAVYAVSNNGTAELTLAGTLVHNRSSDGKPDIFATRNGYSIVTVDAAHSLFNGVIASGGANVSEPGSGTNVTGDPLFTGWSYQNLRLEPGSPAIDRGDPAPFHPSEFDIDGAARNVDGDGDCTAAPDIGAYELQGHAKPCPPEPVPAAAAAVSPGAQQQPLPAPSPVLRPLAPAPRPRISSLRARTGRRGTTATFVLSQAAPVTLVLARERPGQRRGRRCAKPSRALRARRAGRCTRLQGVATARAAGRAGANTVSLGKRLSKGRYRVTLTAQGGASPAVTKVTSR